jgi:hypothetical protein
MAGAAWMRPRATPTGPRPLPAPEQVPALHRATVAGHSHASVGSLLGPFPPLPFGSSRSVMPRFNANLTMLFTEQPFLDRFEAAAKAGFTGVEYLFPYDFCGGRPGPAPQGPWPDPGAAQHAGGRWAGGERGIAIVPGRADEFKAGVEKAIAYATALGCKQVNCIAAIAPAGIERSVLEETFIANLRFAAGRLKQAGIKLLIEAINPIDIPASSSTLPLKRSTSSPGPARTTCSCSMTSATCRSPRATWRAPWNATSP